MSAPMGWPWEAAAEALRRKVGPVPRSQYPDHALALAVARIGERAVETGEVVVTDADLRWLAQVAAAFRPPHPFTRA